MRDPDQRVRFFFTEQVHLIGSGVIPFHTAGLQHRVTTFLSPHFEVKKGGGGGGSGFNRRFGCVWIAALTKFPKRGIVGFLPISKSRSRFKTTRLGCIF